VRTAPPAPAWDRVEASLVAEVADDLADAPAVVGAVVAAEAARLGTAPVRTYLEILVTRSARRPLHQMCRRRWELGTSGPF
jgi:hypothetical protein